MAEPRAAAREQSPADAAPAPAFGIAGVEVSGFRSARRVSFSPGPLCALVGEASAGKSNLLAAIRAALDPAAAPLGPGDAVAGGDGRISIRVRLADGGEASLAGTAERHTVERPPATPPVLFLPAAARAGALVAEGPPGSAEAARALELFRRALSEGGPSSAAPALAVVEALESCCTFGVRGLVLLVEEPELYLRPQAQRYLYRLLRQFSLGGNQVVYSTHSPAFLNVARLDELVFVERLPEKGTLARQPRPVTPDEDFRVLTEFDAARSELFLARAAVLVEGQTEKLVLPFVFAALGYDPDREAISIVECGGKPNIPLFARICRAVGVPFVVVHDSDARPGRKAIASELALNALIAEVAGDGSRVVLDPDFETVA
ncbi:MAG: TOPRIM nucleotidyl transferase/hydrolase domain-containing protein, partial [Gaiellaceae bacterium]